MRSVVAACLLGLAGCTSQLEGYAAFAEEELKRANDLRTGAYIKLQCAAPLGGFERIEEFRIQMAVGEICFPKFIQALKAHLQNGGS